jgi:SulP family sulfate permease
MFGVLIFDTLPGLFIGIAVSVLLLVYRASRPHVAALGRSIDGSHWVDTARHADASAVDGIVVVRPESGLFYANADNVKSDINTRVDDTITALVLDLADVPTVDITAVDMLVDLADDLDRRGVRFAFARDIGQVRDVLNAAGAAHLADAAYPTVDAAVTALTR